MISGLRPLLPLWCLRHHLSPRESISLGSQVAIAPLRTKFACHPAKVGALWMLNILLHGSKVKRRANFPLRGKSRAAGIGVHFHRAKPGCMVFAAVRRHLYWRRKAPTSPVQRVFITPEGGARRTGPEGGADPGLNPWRPGPKARRRHQPSQRSRVNLREYRQAPIPPQKPMASSIAHSKKHRSSDWCFFIIPVHAGLHGRRGHVLRDVRPPLPLQI